MKYTITLKGELWNGFLHVTFAFVCAYVLVPTYSYLVISLTMLSIGAAREVLQFLRKKEQPFYIHVLDAIGFLLGGSLWYLVRILFDIKPDIL